MLSGKATIKIDKSPYKRSMRQLATSLHHFSDLYCLHAEPKMEAVRARKMRIMLERIMCELDSRADTFR